MAEATVSYAVQILGDLLIQKLHFLGSVEGEVRRLKDELKRMQCFLKDADEKQADDERVRHWISEIREVALDSQDAIEIFLVKVENAQTGRGLLRKSFCFPCRSYYVNEVGKEIESIWTRLRDIESSRSRYNIQNRGEATSVTRSREIETLRQLPYWQTDKQLVGMESDVELLLKKVILDENESGLSSATITGIGGIGKSTLARAVFNHRSVADRFERRCWVVVSSELRPKEMMKDLMLQLLKPNEERLKVLEMMEKMEVHNIQEMIHQHLKDTRYFIVVDDVWEDAHWEAIANAFPDQDNGSRLLLTSRNHVKTKHTRYVHPMKVLNTEESWKLLLKKADLEKDDGKCPEEVEDIVRQIMDKCKGLPLAICVVGGILAKLQRQSKTEFEKVLKGINTHLGRSGRSNVSAILELSYQNLPTQLKPCFLCLAFFKEDAAIKAKKLVNIWIALGLIQQKGEETMEEIAMRYLDELINRNMIQVKKMASYERVKSCGMHDLIRDLSISKAKEEMRLEISRDDDDDDTRRSTSESSSYKRRHRAIYTTNDWCMHLDQNKHVRSVFIHSDPTNYESSPSSYWKSFELLRILDLEGNSFNKFPKAICGLIELRYLGIICRKLPRSIGKLKNLVVLYLGKRLITRIPNVLWKMDSLRHLYSALVYSDTPLKLNTLKNMQTLKCIILKDSEVEQVSEMTSLWKLGIDMLEISNGSKLFTSLAKLQNLSCLKLKRCDSLDMEGLATLHHIIQLKLHQIQRLPTNFPPNLSHLSLFYGLKEIEEEEMAVLGKLPKLLHLKLHAEHFSSGGELVISQGSFPMLQVLDVLFLNVESIEMGKGAMSKLKRLDLRGCLCLKSLPQELKEMKNLEELIIPRTLGSQSDVYSHLISNLPSLHVVNETT